MFERTAALLRENFKLFFGIVLVVIGVEIVVGGVLGGSGFWMSRFTAGDAPIMKALFVTPLALLGAALIYIFTQIIQGALFLATQAKLANRPMTVGEACRLAADKAGKLVGISVLVGLRILGYMLLLGFAFIVLFLVMGLVFGGFSHGLGHNPFQFGHGASVGLAVLFGLFLLVFLALYVCMMFWLVIRYALSIPAALAENLSITEAIRRSIRLSKGSRGRLFALFLAVAGVWIVMAAITVPMQLMATHATAIHSTTAFSAVLIFAAAAIRILFSWVLIAFMGVATALCYYDLRVRKEGFGTIPPVPVLEIPPIPPPSTPDWPIEDIPVS